MHEIYTPLHNHDEFSPLDGFSHPHEYLDRIIELGFDSFTTTNHGNQFSWIYYAKLLKQDKYKHIKMIYGVEFYEAFDAKIKDPDNKYFHLNIIAKNENGRKAINELVSRSSLDEHYYYKPRIDLNMIRELNCGKDLVVTSACLASKIARESDWSKAVEYINEYKSLFPHFYLEMQSHKHTDQELFNKRVLELCYDTNTPYVITTDSHSATKEDLYYQGRHVQISQDKDTITESYEGCYIQSVDEIHETMDSQVGEYAVNVGLGNTLEIRDLVEQVKMPFQEPQLPTYPLPNGFGSNSDYLRELVKQGWKKRGVSNLSDEEKKIRRERVEYELGVIKQMGFCGYFIIVWDFINWAKENGIAVGDGRGSASGAYVCFLIGITNIDPIKYDLIFERFLNPERISLPDIDVDFSNREPVIEYITNKYGKNNVCQIMNFSYISPLNSIRDAFRVYGYPHFDATKISKSFQDKTFEECIKNNPSIMSEYPQYADAFKLASKISGRIKTIGIHAGGLGIVDTTMSDYIGLYRGGNGERVIQVDKRNVESIGVIKFDLLGIATLQLVQNTLNDAGITKWDIDVNNEEFINDKKTYNLIKSCNTNSVFQVESQGMKDLIKRLQPDNIYEISAVLALYRPDTMSVLDKYIECKYDESKIEYIHDDTIPILNETYGHMIYQEQMLAIIRKFAGRSYGGADLFRKAIGSKDEDLVKQESVKLYDETIYNGYTSEIADIISHEMSTKGGYGFNKSHSFSYAVLCLQTAYLKAHYPLQFYKALYNLRKDDLGKLNKYITDAFNNNIKVLPPNINKSEMDFTISNESILFGLSSISGVGESTMYPIIEERKANGLYKSLQDLISRTNVTEAQVVALIKSGAIPCKDKVSMLYKYLEDNLYVTKQFTPLTTTPTLLKMRELGIDVDTIKDKAERLRLYNIVKEKEYKIKQSQTNAKRKLSFEEKHMDNQEYWEFETLSMFLTNNPFDDVSEYVTNFEEVEEGNETVIVGIVSQVVNKKNKQKKPYAFMNITTSFGLVQVACWANQYTKFQDYVKRGTKLALFCAKDGMGYSIKDIKPLTQWKQDKGII